MEFSSAVAALIALGFCASLITKEIEASIFTLEKAVRRSDAWENAIKNAY